MTNNKSGSLLPLKPGEGWKKVCKENKEISHVHTFGTWSACQMPFLICHWLPGNREGKPQ